MVELTRRWFLGGALAVAGATVIPMAGLFKGLPRIVGDGIYNDTAGLQAALDGEPFVCDGLVVRDATTIFLRSGTYKVTSPLVIGRDETQLIGEGATLDCHHEDSVLWFKDVKNTVVKDLNVTTWGTPLFSFVAPVVGAYDRRNQ